MTDELLTKYTPTITKLTLIPSGGGLFEVIVGDELVFSKKALGRHAEASEVTQLFEDKTGASPSEE